MIIISLLFGSFFFFFFSSAFVYHRISIFPPNEIWRHSFPFPHPFQRPRQTQYGFLSHYRTCTSAAEAVRWWHFVIKTNVFKPQRDYEIKSWTWQMTEFGDKLIREVYQWIDELKIPSLSDQNMRLRYVNATLCNFFTFRIILMPQFFEGRVSSVRGWNRVTYMFM